MTAHSFPGLMGLAAASLAACLLMDGRSPADAQTMTSENTMKRDAEAAAAPANITDVAWIAGHWQGTAMGGEFEETWNPPLGGSMMGMFKHIVDGQVNFYELLVIEPQGDSLNLRLKHFDRKLHGWEEKDEAVEFPLVKLTDKEAFFDGLTFRQVDPDTLHIFVLIQRGGEASEVRFACQRVKPRASASTPERP